MKLKALGPRTERQYVRVLARAYGPSSRAGAALEASKGRAMQPGDLWAMVRGWLPEAVASNPGYGPETWGEGSRELLRAAITRLWAEGGRESDGRAIAARIPRAFRVKRQRPTPTEEELRRYEAAASALEGDDGLEAMALLPLYLGLRADELLSLTREQVRDAIERGVLVFVRKGAEEAQLPVAQVRSLLEKLYAAPLAAPTHLTERASQARAIAQGTPQRLRVWHTAGQVLTRSERPQTQYAALHALVRSVAKAADLPSWWTPHLLRHGFATRMNRDGAPLFTIQRALGHKNIATTQRYVRPTVEDVKVFMRPTQATAPQEEPKAPAVQTAPPEAPPEPPGAEAKKAKEAKEAKPPSRPGFTVRRKGPAPEQPASPKRPTLRPSVEEESEEWTSDQLHIPPRE